MEYLQGIHTLTDTDELDGAIGYLLDGKSCTAPGITFHLGEHHTCQIQVILEFLRYCDGILSGHGISHEKYLRRIELGFDLPEFLHQLLVNMQTAGSINDNCIEVFLIRCNKCVAADIDRVLICF